MPDLEIDNLTLFLLASAVVLLLYNRFSKPSALVHPLLLGKQAEVSPVRKEGESGVYRSFATGHGTPLIIRPASNLKTVRDVVGGMKGGESGDYESSRRTILNTTMSDGILSDHIHLLPRALAALFPTLANTTPSSPIPILVLLPPNPSTSLPSLMLSIASSPATPLIFLPSPRFLIPALESTAHPTPGVVVVHESLAEAVIEQVCEMDGRTCGVLVFGDDETLAKGITVAARKSGVNVRGFDEIWEEGELYEGPEIAAPQPNDVHSYFYSSTGSDSPPTVVKLTHLNFTAGIAGFLSSFPADKRPNARKNDTVASSEPLTTPMGMTIALAAIWSGAGFSLIGPKGQSWEVDNTADPLDDVGHLITGETVSKPSILILNKAQHQAITQNLYRSFISSPFGNWALPSKVSDIDSGYLSRSGIWDKLVWSSIRSSTLKGLLGDSLRSIIVLGDSPSESTIAWSNALLSIPTARMHSSVLSAGPILSTHSYDIQSSPKYLLTPPSESGEGGHTGAPVVNVEVVLKGVEESKEGSRAEPIKGGLWARGPAFGVVVGESGVVGSDGWTKVAGQASVRTNGTFVLPSHST